MWQRQAEPLMAIFATPREMLALSDATAHYVGYLQGSSDEALERAEAVQLLQRFQERLAAHAQQKPSGEQSDEVQP